MICEVRPRVTADQYTVATQQRTALQTNSLVPLSRVRRASSELERTVLNGEPQMMITTGGLWAGRPKHQGFQ